MEKVLFGISGILAILVMAGIIGVAIHELIRVVKHNKSLKVGDLVFVHSPREYIEGGVGVVVKLNGILYGVTYQGGNYEECFKSELKRIKTHKGEL